MLLNTFISTNLFTAHFCLYNPFELTMQGFAHNGCWVSDKDREILSFDSRFWRQIESSLNTAKVKRKMICLNCQKGFLNVAELSVSFNYKKVKREHISYVRDSLVPWSKNKKYYVVIDNKKCEVWFPPPVYQFIEDKKDETFFLINLEALTEYVKDDVESLSRDELIKRASLELQNIEEEAD